MSIAYIVARLIERYGRQKHRFVNVATPLAQLGVDAIGLAEIVMSLERRFGISIDTARAMSWVTGSEIVDAVESALREQHRQAS